MQFYLWNKIPPYEDVFNEYEWATGIKWKFKLDANKERGKGRIVALQVMHVVTLCYMVHLFEWVTVCMCHI